jgi:enoyl-[acyl-carrier protein] reductase II
LRPFPDQLFKAVEEGTLHLTGGDEAAGVDPDRECYPAGQGIGAIGALVPAGELVRRFVTEAEAVIESLGGLRAQAPA